MSDNYWTKRLSRRTVLRGGATGLLGLGGAALIGCGDDDDDDDGGAAATQATAAATQAAAASIDFKRGGTIRLGSLKLAGGLDPHFSGSGYHKTRTAFDTLLDLDDSGLPQIEANALAESYELLDPTTIVMNLRQGVNFHDREPFNSEAVKWNVSRILDDPPARTPHSAEILHTKEIESVDEHTIRWLLTQPDVGILTAFTSHSTEMLSPPHYDGKELDDVVWNPVGTGRYMFLDYSQDAFVKYQVYPDHHNRLADGGPAGKVDEIHELLIPDHLALATALVAGDIECIDESPSAQIDLLTENPNLHGVKQEGFAIRQFGFNDLPPLDNVDVRRALMWAWDAEAYNEVMDNGIGRIATSLMTSLWPYHIDVPEYPGFDVEKAKMFIERSGVPVSERKLLIGGKTVAFQLLQSAWEKIGFTSEYVAESRGRIYKRRTDNPDVHGSVGSRITSRADIGWQVNVMLRSDAIYNAGQVNTPKIDELSDAGLATYIPEERQEIYSEIQHIYADQLPNHLGVVEQPFWIHAPKSVSGFKHFANGRGDYRNLHFVA